MAHRPNSILYRGTFVVVSNGARASADAQHIVAAVERGAHLEAGAAYAPVPQWTGGHRGEYVGLETACQSALAAAARVSRRVVWSVELGGFPVDRGAQLLLAAVFRFVRDNAGRLDEIRFAIDDSRVYDLWRTAFDEVVTTQLGSDPGLVTHQP